MQADIGLSEYKATIFSSLLLQVRPVGKDLVELPVQQDHPVAEELEVRQVQLGARVFQVLGVQQVPREQVVTADQLESKGKLDPRGYEDCLDPQATTAL